MHAAPFIPPRPHRLGRPRLSSDELRTEDVRTFLNPAERQKLDEDAAAAGLRPNEYVRRLIAEHKPAAIEGRSVADPRLLSELNAIGNLLNQAVRDMHVGSTRRHDWEQLQGLLEIALMRAAYGDVR